MEPSTQSRILAAMADAIFHSEYADRHPVTAEDARQLAAVALGVEIR